MKTFYALENSFFLHIFLSQHVFMQLFFSTTLMYICVMQLVGYNCIAHLMRIHGALLIFKMLLCTSCFMHSYAYDGFSVTRQPHTPLHAQSRLSYTLMHNVFVQCVYLCHTAAWMFIIVAGNHAIVGIEEGKGAQSMNRVH